MEQRECEGGLTRVRGGAHSWEGHEHKDVNEGTFVFGPSDSARAVGCLDSPRPGYKGKARRYLEKKKINSQRDVERRSHGTQEARRTRKRTETIYLMGYEEDEDKKTKRFN